MQRIQFIIQGKLFGQKACICIIMAFIMSSFIHFILKFRDWCKDYYSQLVVHSQFKITLSPILVQAFLSQSIYLLTNNSKCKFTFLFFLCLTCTFSQTYEKKHKLYHNYAFNPKSIHTPIFTKRIKVFHYHIIKIKSKCSKCFRMSKPTTHKQN